MIIWLEDDPDYVELFISDVKAYGKCDVRVANNPDEFYSILSDTEVCKQIVLIILDIQMAPGLAHEGVASEYGTKTGELIIKRIKSNPTTSTIPLIVWTIKNDAELERLCQMFNVQCFKKESGSKSWLEEIAVYSKA